MRIDENHSLELKMNYKVYLQSQYISRRISEIAKQSLEVHFLYGGNVKYTSNNTTIDINDIFIPPKQNLTSSTFESESGLFHGYDYFAKRHKKLVAMGHSHGQHDVFHSSIDRSYLRTAVHNVGTRFKSQVPAKKTAYSYRHREYFKTILTQPYTKEQRVFPSFVFNQRNVKPHVGVAHFDYKLDTFKLLEDFPVTYYNKKTCLTNIDKFQIDFNLKKMLKKSTVQQLHSVNL